MDKPSRYSRLPRVGDLKITGVPNDADHFGWLLLGPASRLVSRTAFPQLFAAFGTAYGAGDGKTTFGLPALGDRFLMAAGSGHGLGAKGGAESVMLELRHLPAHSHKVDKVSTAATASQNAILTGVGLAPITKPPTVSVSTAAQDSGQAGGGEAVPIVPPFFAVNVFVYAGG